MTPPRCAECPLAIQGVAFNPVPARGSKYPCTVAIVGDYPAMGDAAVGRAFSGKTGSLLESLLQSQRIPVSHAYFTNAIQCTVKPGMSEDDLHQAAACCAPRLKGELTEIGKHAPVLALGALASSVLVGHPVEIHKEYGTVETVYLSEQNTRDVMKYLHPASILRSAGSVKHPDAGIFGLARSIQILRRMFDGDAIRVDDIPVEVFYAPGGAGSLAAALRRIHEMAITEGILGIDIEAYSNDERYTALHPKFAQLSVMGLATEHSAVSARWTLWTPEDKALLKQILEDKQIPIKVFHNLTYDVGVCRAYGIDVQGELHCTKQMHQIIYPGARHGLQVAASQYMVTTAWKTKFKQGGSGDDKDRTSGLDYVMYNARDAIAPVIMYREMRREITELHCDEVYANDRLMADVASRMHFWGMPIDVEENHRLYEVFSTRCDEQLRRLNAGTAPVLAKVWEELAGIRAMRVRKSERHLDHIARTQARAREITKELSKGALQWKPSNRDHIAALCAALGHPIQEKTKTGLPATNESVLQAVAADIPLLAGVITYNTNADLLATHVAGLVSRLHQGKYTEGYERNGRIHPIWKVSQLPGRWSAEKPGVMTLPKEDARIGRPNLRAQFKCAPGRMLVGGDYKQMHPRIIAALSQDQALLRILRDPSKDLHTECARMVWPDFDRMALDHQKVLRQAIKSPEYIFWYAGSENTAYMQAAQENPGTTRESISYMYSQLRSSFPGVVRWQEALIAQAGKGEIRDGYGGRRLTFILGRPNPSDAVNFPVLASETRILHRGIANMWSGPLWDLRDAQIVHQMHDSIAVEIDENELDKGVKMIEECMQVDFFGIEMLMDVHYGMSLADL